MTSPAAAALAGFPPTCSRTGRVTVPWCSSTPYEVLCERVGGVRVDVGSSNGPGWKPVGGRGVVTLWGSADGAPVRVEFGGRTGDAQISGNHYFFVEWDVAEPSVREWPRAVLPA